MEPALNTHRAVPYMPTGKTRMVFVIQIHGHDVVTENGKHVNERLPEFKRPEVFSVQRFALAFRDRDAE